MKEQLEITFNDESLTLKEKLYPIYKLWAFLQRKPMTKIQTIEWKEVREAYVYKRDVFAYDLICLRLITNDGKSLELDEHMKGWKFLIDSLPKYLPNSLTFEQWFVNVAFPALKLNLIKIYPCEI